MMITLLHHIVLQNLINFVHLTCGYGLKIIATPEMISIFIKMLEPPKELTQVICFLPPSNCFEHIP